MRRVTFVSLCCLAVASLIIAGCGSGSRAQTLAPSRGTVGNGIHPGVGLGTLPLGATYTEALALLGTPAAPEGSTRGAVDGLAAAYWPAKGMAACFADTNHDGFASPDEKCAFIVVASAAASEGGVFTYGKRLAGSTGFQAFAGLSTEGLGLGSTRDAVRTAFGTPDSGQPIGDWFAARGVAFAYTDAGAAAFACVFAPQAAEEIAAGEGIGPLRVDATYGVVAAAYGAAEDTRFEMTDESAVIYAWWPSRGLWAIFTDSDRDAVLDADEKCILVTAVSPFTGRTADGLGANSTKTQVRQALGTPDEQQTAVDYYLAKGIAFSYDDKGFVVGTRAYEPYLAAAAASTRIMPGAAIGGIRVNGTMAEATAAYGQPASVKPKASSGPAVVLASWPSVGLFALVADSDGNGAAAPTEKVVMVLAASPYAGATTEGVSVWSRREDVTRAYGVSERRGRLDIFAQLGVIFAYTDEGEIQSVAVFRPQAGGAADSILDGRAVGAVWVGATYGAATSRYGAPSLLQPYSDEWQTVVNAYWQDRGLLGIYDDVDKDGVADPGERCIIAYASKPFVGQTMLGIGIGSTKDDVRSVYGEPEDVEGSATDWYWSKGMVFNYTAEGILWNIGVFGPLIDEDPNIPKRIQPGVGVGAFLLGMNLADAKAVYGDPSKVTAVTAGNRTVLLAIWAGPKISATFVDSDGDGQIDADETCDMIWARAPYSGTTDEGVGTGSLRDQVYNAFGTPEESQSDFTDWYWSKGLVFNFTLEGDVLSIGVFASRDQADRTLAGTQGKAAEELRSRMPAGRGAAALRRALNRQ